MAYRLLIPAVFLGICCAQAPTDLFTRAPEPVDRALRERIREFYQYHVDGKYRQAEQLVAEDTKDFFYSANKPRYLSFEINRIEYSDDFTRAKATVLCEQYVMMPGFGDKPVKVPIPSNWKLVDGKWFWYVDEKQINETPFGTVKRTGSATGPAPHMPQKADLRAIFAQVKADRSEIALEPDQSAEITITNGAPGPVSLSVFGKVAGIDAKLDRKELKAGENAVLRVHRARTDKTEGTIQVRVDPMNQIIPIRVK